LVSTQPATVEVHSFTPQTPFLPMCAHDDYTPHKIGSFMLHAKNVAAYNKPAFGVLQ